MNTYVDVCLLSIVNKKLSVLLIKRGFEPFKDMYSLAGCKYIENLTPLENAQITLEKELGLKNIYVDQLKTYGSNNRDPRGSSVSICYLALVDFKKINTMKTADATESIWVPVEDLFKTEVAFDHKEMIQEAIVRVKNQIRYTKIGFSLIGDSFTIGEVASTFENVLDIKIDVSNLRKKLLFLGVIKESSEKVIKGRGRPQPIYLLDNKAFNSLDNGECFFKH